MTARSGRAGLLDPAEVVIDLDDRSTTDGSPSSVPPPGPNWRAIAMALVLLLTGGTAAGSAPRPGPGIIRTAIRPMPPAGHYALAGDLVIISSDQRHTAVSTVDGRDVWSIPSTTSGGTPASYFARMADDLLMGHFSSNDGYAQDSGYTALLDPATGRERWRTTGLAYLDEQIAVEIRQPDPAPSTRSELTGRDPLTGRPLWSVSSTETVGLDRENRRLLLLAQDGGYTERDIRTGEVTRRARLALPAVPLGDVRVTAGRLVVTLSPPGSAPVNEVAPTEEARFDPATLAPLPADPQARATRSYDAQDCGPVWCVGSYDYPLSETEHYQVEAKDTGKVLYRLGLHEVLSPYPFGLLVTGTSPVPFGRPALRVVDSRTGHTITDLHGWQAVDPSDHATSYLVALAGEGRTAVAVATAGGVRQRGVLPYEMVQCSGSGDRLVCQTLDGQIGIWQVTP